MNTTTNAAVKAAGEQLLNSIATSRAALTERLTNWDRMTQSALVGEQWIICTPDASNAYTLKTLRDLGNGQSEFSSDFCKIENAPLYSKENGQKMLARQLELRQGQELVLMHIREAITKNLDTLDMLEQEAKSGLARLESAYALTESCPEKAIVQHTERGNYNYSEHSSLDAAWEAEKGESWVSDWVSNADYEDEIAINEARQSFIASLCEYSKDEILAAADEGYGWPEELGFVKAKE